MKHISGSGITLVPVILTTMATVALANVIVFFPAPPGESPGVPAYARIERAPYDGLPLVHHDKEWAAIVFYRDPACVPGPFNLLEFFDPPAAFNCPMTVEGFEIWKNGPEAGDLSPVQVVSHGAGAVPVWFVRWEALRAALQDNLLTIGELSALAPVKGTASFFKETLHPGEGPSGGSAKNTKLQMVARGLLEDGRTFDLQSEENTQSETRDIEAKTITTISFK